MRQTGSLFHMHGGVINGGTTTGNGGAIRISAGSMVMDGGTINGGTASRGGAIAVNKDVSSKATLTVNDGLITGGTATATYGGGNVYVNYVTVTINGGTITKGTATSTSHGGGNLGSRLGKFIINGGTISDGTTAGALGGGNVLVSGTNAALTMNGGTITGGTSSKTGNSSGGGNVFLHNNSVFTQNAGVITKGTSDSGYGGGNIYMDDSTYNMYGGELTYGTATHTSCRGGGNIYVQSDDCVVNIYSGTIRYGWIANGNGNNIHQRYGKLYMGEGALLGTKGSGTKGSMSVYLYSGTVESYATFTGGFSVRAGSVYIKGGKYYSFYYNGSTVCEITGGLFRYDYSNYVPEGYRLVSLAATDAYKYTVLADGETTDTVLVKKNGTEVFTYEPVALFNADTYSHIKLYRDFQMEILEEQDLWVDLCGKNLTVTGNGHLNAFDSANDTYDAAACGSITNNGTVAITQDVLAPNGNRYVALTQDNVTTTHRLTLHLSSVSLRAPAMGIYYKAAYYCDDVLVPLVRQYGVVVSINNMPGEDFAVEEGDINRYTVAAKPFESGIIATSGSIFGIMKDTRTPEQNGAYGDVTIYANPYILLDLGTQKHYLGDMDNADKQKTDAGFTGKAFSLHDVMDMLDASYESCTLAVKDRLDAFYYAWKDKGMSWDFENIGKNYSRGLELTDSQAYCPACQEIVTWTALDQETYATTPYGATTNGTHLYLAEDITYSGTDGSAFIIAPTTTAHTTCVHLNGHNLTATADKAFYGHLGVLNVMGEGVVSGYASTSNQGSTVQINTYGSNGKVNLYSGTYRQSEGTGANCYVVAIQGNGGAINVYKRATVEANVTGKAAWTGLSYTANSTLGLYNTQVDGDIYMSGASQAEGKISKLILENSRVNGTLDINGVNTVILEGAPVVELLDVATTTLLTLDSLCAPATIPVNANGVFTTQCEQASAYLQYFKAAQSGKKIVVEDDALVCQVDYLAALELEADHTGYCPVCKKTVTWTAVDSADAPVQLTNGAHLYLTQALTYAGTDAPFISAPAAQGETACLHLNGNNITATARDALFSGAGILNVMGAGTVTGYADSESRGAAVTVDSAVTGAAINLYSGTFQKDAASAAAAGAVAIGNVGGTLKLYGEATVAAQDNCAIYVGACTGAKAALTLSSAKVQGSVVLTTPQGYASAITVDSATITETLQVAAGNEVTLSGRPKIGDVVIPEGTLLTLKNMLVGAQVGITAEGVFTNTNTSMSNWLDYFTATDGKKWIVVTDNALCCEEKKTLPNGGKILVIGNSMTYYTKYVIDKGHVLALDTRRNDQGYLYQVCAANDLNVSVTNFTFGNHSLKDFYSGSCKANRGHNGHNHLEDLTDRNYDYVILQEGNSAASNTSILEECKPLMDFFLEGNPNTKFVFQVQYTVHIEETAWRESIRELEENGIIVVDWGAMVADLINGNVTPPDAKETYSKFSLVVNKTSVDGRHPNVLAGYLAAQMTYCAITGESAVGQDYSFWNDTNAHSSFNLAKYKKTFYAYDATVPSNTNFEAIFASTQEMTGLQKLIDLYLAKENTPAETEQQ